MDHSNYIIAGCAIAGFIIQYFAIVTKLSGKIISIETGYSIHLEYMKKDLNNLFKMVRELKKKVDDENRKIDRHIVREETKKGSEPCT